MISAVSLLMPAAGAVAVVGSDSDLGSGSGAVVVSVVFSVAVAVSGAVSGAEAGSGSVAVALLSGTADPSAFASTDASGVCDDILEALRDA
jgi:hypothetical protein